MNDPFLGKKIDEYTIHELFAQGGQGNIYTVREAPGILVKIFHNLLTIDRAKREIAALKRLRHPGFVKIVKAGKYNGYPYFSMEQIPGQSLKSILEESRRKSAPFGTVRSLLTAWKLADAMGYAHNKGIVHRDLKPENIIMSPQDQPVILDLGLVRQSGARTLTSTMIGTPLYMAPEQVQNTKGSDTQIDVYALGTILYEMLTGHWPLAERLPAEVGLVDICNMILRIPPRNPREYVPELSEETVRICLKCLEKDRSKRYPHAEGLKADLWPEVLAILKKEAQSERDIEKGVRIVEQAMVLKGYESTCGFVREFFESRTGKKVDIFFVKPQERERYEAYLKKTSAQLLPVLHISRNHPYLILERTSSPLADRVEDGYQLNEEEIFRLLGDLRRALEALEEYRIPISLDPKDVSWGLNARFAMSPEEDYAPLLAGHVIAFLQDVLHQPPALFEGLIAELKESEEPLPILWAKAEKLQEIYREILQIDEQLEGKSAKVAVKKLMEALKQADKKEALHVVIGSERLARTFQQVLSDKKISSTLRAEIHRALAEIPAEILGEIADQDAVPALIEMLNSQDEEKCLNAASALAKFKDERAIPALVSLLHKSRMWTTRQAALTALEFNGWIPADSQRVVCLIVRKSWEEVKPFWREAMPHLLRALELLKLNYTSFSFGEVKSFVELFGLLGDERAVPHLTALLQSDEQLWLRRSATSALGQIGSSHAVPALRREIFNDEEWAVAMQALAEIGDKRAIPSLFRTLASGQESAQRIAARAIAQIGAGEKSWLKLEEMLSSSEPHQRRGAALAAGEIGDKRALPRLLALLEDEIPSVRKAAIESIGRVGDPDTVGELAKGFKKEREAMHEDILQALADIGGKEAAGMAMKALKMKPPSVRAAAVRALGRIGGPDAASTLMKFAAKEKEVPLDAIIQALGELRQEIALPMVRAALSDERLPVRKAALEACGKLADRESIPQLVNAWKYRDIPKELILEALGDIGDESITPLLIEVLESRESYNFLAARAIGKTRDATAIPALVRALGNFDRNVRQAAVEALGNMDPERAAAPLLEALQDVNKFVRQSAVQALGSMPEEIARPAIFSALRDREATVRKKALDVLEERDWKPSRDEENALYYIARLMWDKVFAVGKAAVPELLEVVERWDGSGRIDAAKVAVEIGLDEPHREKIRKLMTEQDADVRKTAVLIAGRIRDKKAIPVLQKTLRDPEGEVRRAAKRALRYMGETLER